jgi:ABC-type Fe3+ transport system permease subunit
VTLFSLALGYPLAYFLSFYAAARKDLLYQMVIIPLWVSYLVRAYAWKTILGSDGVLNTLLQYVHLTSHSLEFLLYSRSQSCRSMLLSSTSHATWSRLRMTLGQHRHKLSGESFSLSPFQELSLARHLRLYSALAIFWLLRSWAGPAES